MSMKKLQRPAIAMGTRRFTVAAALVGALLTAAVPAAHAAGGNTVSRGSQAHWITASYDGLNVAVADGSTAAGTQLIQWYNDGAAEQKWYFDQVYDSVGGFMGYELRNENSGMCLFNDGIAGDWMYQEPCDPNNAAEYFWHFGSAGSDNWFEGRLGSLFVDVSGYGWGAGSNIDGWYQNNQANQDFWVTNVSS